MTDDLQPHNLATIRSLLLAAFTAEDLRRFCQAHPSFRPIVDRFGPGLWVLCRQLVAPLKPGETVTTQQVNAARLANDSLG